AAVHFQIGGLGKGIGHDFLDVKADFLADSDTQVVVEWTNGFTASWGNEFDLFDWLGLVDWGGFDASSGNLGNLILPELASGNWYWDTTDFLESGVIRVAPEPGRALLLFFALGALLMRRRRQTV
ncbi:MAG TPA: PEP-CTERM sorting domain-containing protein, partial [Verrucomicrobium sp.]|nr:PEP-CTERM sorting domain-containing protein [Verrucomicrobium sp.]